MKTGIPKQKEVYLTKFDFGYPKKSKHEVIGKLDPAILDRVHQEEKILSLSAPSVTVLVNLIIPQHEHNGWKADIAGSKLLYQWFDESEEEKSKEESEPKKMTSKMYQVVFRKVTVKFNAGSHEF